MVEAARRRCRPCPNVSFATCSGLDLRELDAQVFDVVFAIDTFPYLLQSGMSLVRRHFDEAARVLRQGGDLVVLNFSYRNDAAEDRVDVASLASQSGFEVIVNGETPFDLWNGSAFRLRAGAR
jgi:ubiquinone/menaquinone biosynthesis C-methylase UbiE